MRRYLIAVLIVVSFAVLTSGILRRQRMAGDSARAADNTGQRKRPTPTPRPTPRPNMNDGGGVHERGNANAGANMSNGGDMQRQGGRRGRLPSNANVGTTDANANTNDKSGADSYTAGETNANASTTGRRRYSGRRKGRPRRAAPTTDDAPPRRAITASSLADGAINLDTPADLSGTYAGRVSDEARGVINEEATLKISGTNYTLEGASLSRSGRFIVNTTRGYHAVTMELGPSVPGQSFAPFISVRAHRVGTHRLILRNVSGERYRFSFVSTGSKVTRSRPPSRKS